MVESIVEFYKNLPPKTCATCEIELEEQHECYSNICHSCTIS